MRLYRNALSTAIVCAVLLFCSFQVGCGRSLQPAKKAEDQAWWKEQQEKEACITNLMCIAAAKEQWAILTGKPDGEEIVKSEVDSYIKRLPATCPSEWTYTYGKVGEPPKCSVVGHVLEEQPHTVALR